MSIQRLTLSRFRNIEDAIVTFDEGENFIFGDNAQGKTNLLEAVSFCSLGKSFRTQEDGELCKFDAPMPRGFYLECDYTGKEKHHLTCLYDGKKTFQRDGKNLRFVKDVTGKFPTVLFTPDHMQLLKGGGSERRKFINIALCQQDNAYLETLSRYQVALREKSAMLRKGNNDIFQELWDFYNEKTVEYGTPLCTKRKAFMEDLAPRFAHYVREMSGEEATLTFLPFYRNFYKQNSPSLETYSEKTLGECWLEEIKKSRDSEFFGQRVKTGVQLDDFTVTLNGKDLRDYGSQGQIRTCVLALKLAEGDWMEEKTGVAPTYLFDDVFSELDAGRKEYLANRMNGKQVIYTGTKLPTNYQGNAIKVTDGVCESATLKEGKQ